MRSGSQAIWELCSRPRVEECEDSPGARCWVCAGDAGRSADRESWMGSSFVGQNKVRCPESSRVCEPCLFVMSRIAPVPGRPPAEGKKFGGNFRNYSHLWENGGFYQNASKGEKPLVREFLRRDHASDWFAAIADSGQKHVIPWVPWNPPGRSGLALFDETIVRVGPALMATVDAMAALLTAGTTKDEITSGEYTAYSWMRCPDMVRAFEDAHGSRRGGAEFGLSIWLAQRDEEAVAERQAEERKASEAKKVAEKARAAEAKPKKRKDVANGRVRSGGKAALEKATGGGPETEARAADGGSADGDPRGVPGDSRLLGAEALGPAADADETGRENVRERRGVVDGDAPAPATPRAAQLDLFGACGAGKRSERGAARQ